MTRKRGSLEKATRAFEDFTGHKGADVVRVNARNLKEGEALTVIGSLVAVAYEATRDGETAHYEHEFRESSRPVLAVSADGKQLYVLAGAYKFTHRGIEDR